MGMRAHYVQLDSGDMTNILDNRKAACEILMAGSSMRSANRQDVLTPLGKEINLKAMEKRGLTADSMPYGVKGSSGSSTQKQRPSLAIEKSWQAIHFILNGDPWKGSGLLHNAVLGGTEVGEDLGYGRPRYVDPFKVVQTSAALDRITDDEFKKKARAADFSGKGIYVYEDRLSAEDFEELVDYFGQIRAFFRAAADKSNGILLGIV
jgi:hypothetical protein